MRKIPAIKEQIQALKVVERRKLGETTVMEETGGTRGREEEKRNWLKGTGEDDSKPPTAHFIAEVLG